MTVRAAKFSPEVLLAAPRRGPAIPNAEGTHALYTLSTYSFERHSNVLEIRIYDLKSGQSSRVTDHAGVSDPNWLGDGLQIAWLQRTDDGKSQLIIGDGSDLSQDFYPAVTFDGPTANLKLTILKDEAIAVAVTAQAGPDGHIFNPSAAPKSRSTGLVYNSLFVRHWDTYISKQRNSIFYASLQKTTVDAETGRSRYSAAAAAVVVNALNGSKLESPVPTFGGADHFDISNSGIIFVAKDPKLNPATHTKTDVYIIRLTTFTETPAPKPKIVASAGLEGASTSPVFSPDAKSAAFLRMKDAQYESDKNRIIILPKISDPSKVVEVLSTEDGKGEWNLSPSSIFWSNDGESLFLAAEEKGRGRLFVLPSDPDEIEDVPSLIFRNGYVSDVRPLSNDSSRLFISSSNLIDNSLWSTVEPDSPSESVVTISSNTNNGKLFGLSQSQVSEVWFQGAGSYKVHAWVMTPSKFDKSKKYPLAYLIHGGPQGAWGESWSTRWNPAVFAEQGYVVVAPNPTGSTGYGQDFTDGIQDQWGGRPYQDLVRGFEYIRENMKFVDADRAVALGASYGGYMMNWIQGQSLGRSFKALVTHDGVFSTLNQMASDELYFPYHDFKGYLWTNRDSYERWDPARFASKWETPHLIIHNELDYRLPISEGLAAFNVLQARGVESKFLSFPDENHWVLKPENSLLWHRVVINWINKFVGLPKLEEAVDTALSASVEGLGVKSPEGDAPSSTD